MQLVRPAPVHLPAYTAALRCGWSPDNVRGAVAAREELERIAVDPQAFLALMDDTQGLGPPVTLADGTQRPRLPSLRRWMWDDGRDTLDAAPTDGFIGSIGLRWVAGGGPLPPHVLGHIGYTVVPWQQRRGHATRALALLLPLCREQGLSSVDITTDPENFASQHVITRNGGVRVEIFDKGEVYGHQTGVRFRLAL